jgi:hypothetical protein
MTRSPLASGVTWAPRGSAPPATFERHFTIDTGSKFVSPLFVRNGQYYVPNFRGEIQTAAYTGTTGAGTVSSAQRGATTGSSISSGSATDSGSPSNAGAGAPSTTNGTTLPPLFHRELGAKERTPAP